jgi:hypothetical protein
VARRARWYFLCFERLFVVSSSSRRHRRPPSRARARTSSLTRITRRTRTTSRVRIKRGRGLLPACGSRAALLARTSLPAQTRLLHGSRPSRVWSATSSVTPKARDLRGSSRRRARDSSVAARSIRCCLSPLQLETPLLCLLAVETEQRSPARSANRGSRLLLIPLW